MDRPIFAIGLQNYRGIGPDWQFMSNLTKFNFFIGANNAGKSAVLNFLSRHVSEGVSEITSKNLTPLEQYDGGVKGPPAYAFGLPSDSAKSRIASVLKGPYSGSQGPFLERLIEALSTDGTVWLSSKMQGKAAFSLMNAGDPTWGISIGKPQEWRNFWESLQSASSGAYEQHWFPQAIEIVKSHLRTQPPKIQLIPAKRQIGAKDEAFSDYSGAGLIDRLASAQSPDWDRREDRKLFDSINSFVAEVIGDSTATIEVPHSREQILVRIGGRILPLSSLGTGIHELVLIAAFCTLSRNEIVCIEEPEIHLHPLMQRRLVRYLQKNTENQYFIATHSAAFIDTPGASIYHVRHDGDQVRVSQTRLAKEKFDICSDLGYRASDIVQSNAILWVEGPSDRIYVEKWISDFAPELFEGIHYSIMFYGGRLLSHLSAESHDVDDFISLLALNRNSAIIMDSDKSSPQSKINATKQRVREDFSRSGAISWVTSGREIENYLTDDIVDAALKGVYGSRFGGQVAKGRYDHVLPFYDRGTKVAKGGSVPVNSKVDKVAVARIATSGPSDLGKLDLKDQITSLVQMIRKANAD